MRSPLRFLSLLALILIAGGCDTTEPAPRGVVQGIVMAEGDPLPGVTVEVSGPRNASMSTDEAGRYAFDELPAGAYVVSIRGVPSDAAFPSTSRSAAVPEAGTVTVDFQGNFIRTASIIGTVTSRDQGLAGVTVRLEGTETATTLTDSEGEFRFPALRSGAYTVEISSFPSSVIFNAPRTEVQLTTGQTHAVTFQGTPELTASVVIQSLLRRTSSGALESIDPDNVHGRIEVQVSLDRGQDRPDSLLVLLGGQVVGRQLFDESGGAGGLELEAVQELNFPVNTAAFDAETGEARFKNGELPLTVRLATREGGASASSATTPVTLRNQDTFVARLEAGAGPVVGDDGNAWVGGDLEVDLLPVLYTPDRSISSVTVELRRLGGSQIARQSDSGTPPFRIVLSPTATGPSSLASYRTPSGSIDQLRVTQAGYAQGGAVSGLPAVVGDSLRVDQRPPEPTTFALPTQGSASTCCLQSWVGSAFTFVQALGELVDDGVGGVVPRIHAGPASYSDSQLRNRSPVEGADELDASGSNSAYRAIAVLEDALGNARTIPLSTTSANPVSNERGAVFGIDGSPPAAQLDDSGSGLSHYAVNPPSGASWVLTAVDTVSGIPSVPFRSVLLRYAGSLGTEPICLFPGGDACEPAPDGFLRSLPDDGEGYFRLRSTALDRAGNMSEPIDAWVLRDTEDPEVPALQVPASVSGGSPVTITGLAVDNVDLHRARVGIRFGASGPAFPFSEAAELGEPFTESLTVEASFQRSFPFVTGLESVNSSSIPSGNPSAARDFVGTAVDAAGNLGSRVAPIPGASGLQPRSFRITERGTTGGIAFWTLDADASRVCGRGIGVSAGCESSDVADAVTLRARARGEGGSLVNPFQTVHFVALDADGGVRWLGSSGTGELLADAGGEDGRVWGWDILWLPDPWTPEGSQEILAIGVDANGSALRTLSLTSVEVVPAP